MCVENLEGRYGETDKGRGVPEVLCGFWNSHHLGGETFLKPKTKAINNGISD